jgi:hypothetical protein
LTCGEKVIDDIDLDEEKMILAEPNGFKIITLYNNQKFNKQEESAWARGMNIATFHSLRIQISSFVSLSIVTFHSSSVCF